ncbi:hypothetical protein R0G64_00845 [Pseudomonas otitidis]|uniref:Lipoprotein n=1 Tax=Metapseudomonas otitidis TaxID=319939 RepID=A0ABU3XJ50_9GAMM|nr:hypothetical protein [Pseudomonas otitidis]MDV3437972.1 hypothetical protein [Pseudomonas otitidis]
MKGPFAAVLLALSMLTGCVTVPQGTDFPTPDKTATTSQQSVALASVEVTDKTFVNWNAGKPQSTGMTLSLGNYLKASNRFSNVRMPGQAVAADDQVLSFSFDTYNVHRRPYGGYFPFAIVTLTGYIWFGGTTHIDESNVSGRLQVSDAQGKLLYSYQTRQHAEHSVSLYSMGTVNGSPERRSALDDLLNQYQSDLGKHTK